MKQLGNQDAGFIYSETPTTPMHIAGLGIYDQSTAPGGRLGHKDIIKYVQDRIHFAPIFRRKLVQVPFGLDRPYWIDDPDFDIEFHIRHIALPQPGDWRQLCILASRINSRPLDFNRPLWEAYVIEGLDNVDGLPEGSFAILVKVHHSAVDGASGQSIFGALHDLTPDATPIAPDKPLTVERVPNNLELLARSVSNNIKRPAGQAKNFYKTVPNMIRQGIKLYRGELESGCKLKVPDTRFNKAISPHRVFEGTHFALDDIKYIKNTLGQGTTVNDVMLGIVGGALHRYLSAQGETPEGSLCATLPQDIRDESEKTELGNKVGSLFANLHSDVSDPLQRLIDIHSSTQQAKQLADTMGTAAFVQNYMGGFLNPYLGKGLNKLMQRGRVLERLGPVVTNTLMTNVPGPNFPLYHAGARMVSYWGIPPLLDCLGIAHAVFSYCGDISLSVTACRSMLPDPSFYMECVNETFEEMLAAAKAKEAAEKKPTAKADGQAAPKQRKASTARKAAPKKAAAKKAASKPAETKATAQADVNTSEDLLTTVQSDSNVSGMPPRPERPARRRSAASAPATPSDEAGNTGKASDQSVESDNVVEIASKS